MEILSAPDEQPLPVLISLLKSVYFNFCLSLFHYQAHPHNFVHHFFPVKPIIRSYKDLLQTRVLKSDSHLPGKKMLLFASMIALQKWWKMLFYLKALFVLKIYKFLSWLLVHVQKTAWLQRYDWFQNLWHHSLVKKELQNTFYSISHELKATRQLNLVS